MNTTGMTPSAWIFMGTVWTVVLGMTVYCFAKLLTSKQFTEPDHDPDHTPTFKPEDEDGG
jgi:heme/copper-type cytochrome/quinol oxidase subunit 2